MAYVWSLRDMSMQMLINKLLFLFVIIKNMGSKKAFLFLSAIFFAVFTAFVNRTSAQKNGSLYFSVGDSKAWFFPSTIHIEQNDLGNSYKMVKVAADNKSNAALSALQLSYRIGYYYNYEQTWGVEANFDPLNYHIVNGSVVHVKGTINNVPNVDRDVIFSAANGYYYFYNGANIFLLNLVRRIQVFKPASNKVRIDVLAKVGAGPALPHFVNSLPVNPVADPQMQFGGWNAGAEVALRVTVYRYGFVELAGKYDYASLTGMKVYDGTAHQNMNSYEGIASIGFTFPTTRFNPLFWNEPKITTILPFYQQSKLMKEGDDAASDKDSTDRSKFNEIPPFQDIIDKETLEAEERYAKLHPPDTFTNADSIAHVDSVHFADSVSTADSIMRQDSTDHVLDSLNSRKERRRRKHQKDTVAAPQVNLDSMANSPANTDSLNKMTEEAKPNKAAEEPKPDKAAPAEMPPDTTGSKPPPDEKISKKDEKKKAKQDKKDAKKKEKEEKEKAKQAEKEAKEKAKQAEEEAKKKSDEEEAVKKQAEQDKADKEKQDNTDKKDGQ